MSNNPFTAFVASIKSLFGPKPAGTSAETTTSESASAAGTTEAPAKRPASTFSKLQSIPAEKSADSPSFPRQTHDQMYQASKGGADATKAPRRASSTFTKLQALSASGTGAAANEPPNQDSNLNSLLDRLDKD